jgi:hypothetical protein
MDLLESTTMRNVCGGSGGGLSIAHPRILMNWIGAEP